VTSSLVLSVGQRTAAVVLASERSLPANQADTRQMLVWLLVAGAAIGVVSLVLVVANRVAHRWRYNSHAGLFRGLCKLHGVDSASRRLLKRVVRFHRLGQPARLFIEPKWLDPAELGPSFQTRAADLEKLRNALFKVHSTAAEGE